MSNLKMQLKMVPLLKSSVPREWLAQPPGACNPGERCYTGFPKGGFPHMRQLKEAIRKSGMSQSRIAGNTRGLVSPEMLNQVMQRYTKGRLQRKKLSFESALGLLDASYELDFELDLETLRGELTDRANIALDIFQEILGTEYEEEE
jgi:hypothetical protein